MSQKVENEPRKLGNTLLQTTAAISASITVIGASTSTYWTSPALPYLKKENPEFSITESEAAWIASSSNIGSVISSALTPLISTSISRKNCLLLSSLLQVISWILIIFAKNAIILIMARFISGISFSLACNFTIIYVGEIADKNIRGSLLLLVKISLNLGNLIIKTAGAYLSYEMMNLSMVTIPIFFFLLFYFVPESPYYLLIQHREKEAQQTLMKLRGTKNQEIINPELVRVENAVKESQENEKLAIGELFSSKGNRKSLLIVLSAYAAKYSSGRIAILTYTEEIFSYSGFSLKPEFAAMIMAAIGVMMVILAGQLIERAGRKKLFLFSGIFSFFGLGIVGLFFFLKYNIGVDTTSIDWLPFFGLIVYEIFSSFGITSVPFVIVGEMFALNVKATGIALCSVAAELITFVLKLIFYEMNESVGVYSNFWVYAVCCLVGTLVFYFIAPETKGKTLEEIQDILHLEEGTIKSN